MVADRVGFSSKGYAMDPITAIFNFLCTPVGQKIAGDAEGIVELIVDLVRQVHSKNATATSNVSVSTTTTVK